MEDEHGTFGILGDAWGITLSFLGLSALERFCLVSKSMNALVWKTMKTLDFAEADPDKNPPCEPARLLEYLKKSPKLESLFVRFESLPENPQHLAEAAPKLEEIEFYRNIDEAIPWSPTVLTGCWTPLKNLKKLILNYSLYRLPFDDAFGVYPNITHLELDGPHSPAPDSKSDFLYKIFPNLETLIMEIWDPASLDFALFHPSTLKNLKSLRFWGSDYPRLLNVDLLTQCSNLTDLIIDDCAPDSFQALTALESLEILQLDGCEIPSETVQSLFVLTKLQQLDVFRCPIRLEDLKPLTHLERIYYSTPIHTWNLPNEKGTLEALKDHTKLTSLNIHHNRQHYGHYISGLTNLTQLPLGNCDLGDNGVFHLRDLTNLESLDIADNDISNQGWGYLTQLTNLVNLNLNNNSRIDDFGLRRLRLFPFLERVDLRKANIDGRGLDQLTGLVHLDHLGLSFTNLRSKYFSHLTKLNLIELDVSYTPITDHALVCLKNLKTCMSVLMFKCPNVSRKALLAAQETPQVDLKWEDEFLDQ